MLPIIGSFKILKSSFIKQIFIVTDRSNIHVSSRFISNEKSVVKGVYPSLKQNACVLDIPFREPVTHRLLNIVSKEDINGFLYALNSIVKHIININDVLRIPKMRQWYLKVMLANNPSGQENPGLTTLVTYKLLEKPECLTKEKIELANVLGILADMWHVVLSTHDDIIDQSYLRKGNLCWYRMNNIGNYVLRDIVTMENTLYTILRIYFREYPYYKSLLTLYMDLSYRAYYSELMDIITSKKKISNIESYTIKTYLNVAKYRVSCYSYYLPLGSAMFLANIYDENIHKQVRLLSEDLCLYNAVENDYLDCFEDTSISGKDTGSDIREGRCSWVIATAVEKATQAQKKEIWKHIGRQEDAHVTFLIDLFREMGIIEDFYKYRKESYEKADRNIKSLHNSLPKEAFYVAREIAYKRFLE